MIQSFLKSGGILGWLALMATPPALPAQVHFANAEQAANRFVVAVARGDQASISAVLGDDYREVLPVEQTEPAMIDKFLNAWATYHTLVPLSDEVRLLAAGENGWTLPIPIVREAEGWRFDIQSGRDMMRARRIGRNELAAIQAAFAYHDAQIEYAAVDHDGDGLLEYAQRFVSSDGKQDGLYWKTEPGTPESPLGSLFAAEVPTDAYHGYHYRILTAQGAHAPGGAENYLRGTNLIGGFGLVAWPAVYGESGIMSFQLGPSGTLYQADLGPDGDKFAAAMSMFDPDPRWEVVRAKFTELKP